MPDAVPRPTIAALWARIAHLEDVGTLAHKVLPFGVHVLDRRLPQGGVAMESLHEVAGGDRGR